jgi:hypothetical protein
VTEAEWLGADDPRPLLRHLRDTGQASARKWRLLACAALRAPDVWPLLVSNSSRRAVEVSEAFAEGAASGEDLTRARKCAYSATYSWLVRSREQRGAAAVAHNLCWHDAQLLMEGVFAWNARGAESLVPVGMIREVIGNPFRPATLHRAWLTPTVASFALAAYDERSLPSGELDTVRLPVLADALEEAGCIDADVFSHLRSPGPHVRGCWALDLILGKA